MPHGGLQWDRSNQNPRIGCAAMATALLLCPEASLADQGGGSFWFPGQFASFAAMQQTPGWALSVNYYHSSVAAAGSVAAARQILSRQNSHERKRQSESEPERAGRSGGPHAILCFRDAGAWRSVGRRPVRPVRQSRRQYRRNTDGDSRTDRGNAHRSAGRLAYLLRGPRADRGATMDLWRQQLYGLCHRQYSRRRL